ncbi:hypothetical protein AB0I77_47655 [Streptomyces sp. NPDC050619]|uniref:hypothetical protein n=1 Tax=Streptomyces sp. NPDC050619 TaxID=3157214 RepID=UPI00342A4B29
MDGREPACVQLPPAAADLLLLGDLTGRYAVGSYSKLASDGRRLVLRAERQGAAEHGHRITAAIACDVARIGGTVDHLRRLLLHPEHEGAGHARNIALPSGQSRALDYIRRVWAGASETVSTTRTLHSRHDAVRGSRRAARHDPRPPAWRRTCDAATPARSSAESRPAR